MKKLPNKLSKLLSVVLLWGAFSVPFAFAAVPTVSPDIVSSTSTIITVTVDTNTSLFLFSPSCWPGDACAYEVNLDAGASGDTWDNQVGDLTTGTYKLLWVDNVYLGDNPTDACNLTGLYSDCLASPAYLGTTLDWCFQNCDIIEGNGLLSSVLSSSSAAALLNGSVSDVGSFLGGFIPSILGILVALLALGMGIRYVRKHVSGRKF